MRNKVARYSDYLGQLPAPGYGDGYHTRILGAANLGFQAGRNPEQIVYDIRQATKPGKRSVLDREIRAAVERAAADFHKAPAYAMRFSHTNSVSTRKRLINRDPQRVLQHIIDQGAEANETSLWDASPIRIDWGEPFEDTVPFLSTMYDPTDRVFIAGGEERGLPGRNIRLVEEWITFFQHGGKAGPYIIINPLSDKPAPKKDGTGTTFRGDRSVVDFRFCLAEFDKISIDAQIKFWSAVRLPIRALVHSGGKSIHAWLDVSKLAEVKSLDGWETHIKRFLYDECLTPLGVDAACSNPARLSRLPGCYRHEKQTWQRILWLSPKGRSVVHP